MNCLCNLPVEIITKITSFLNLEDMFYLSATCRHLAAVSSFEFQKQYQMRNKHPLTYRSLLSMYFDKHKNHDEFCDVCFTCYHNANSKITPQICCDCNWRCCGYCGRKQCDLCFKYYCYYCRNFYKCRHCSSYLCHECSDYSLLVLQRSFLQRMCG